MLVAVLSLVWSVGAACAADVANRKMVGGARVRAY